MVSYFFVREKYMPYYEKYILEGFIMLSLLLKVFGVMVLVSLGVSLVIDAYVIKNLGIKLFTKLF